MSEEQLSSTDSGPISRRALIKSAALVAGAAALTPSLVFAQAQTGQQGTPPSVITNPPRQWGPGIQPETYGDPDIIVVDPAFGAYMLGITAIHRLTTGFRWAEGPAWSAQGNYMLWSDVQGNIQYRMIWEDMRVPDPHEDVRATRFRDPSYNSNGNSFDFQGRQLSTEDFNRRVMRWENDGSMTVIADSYNGKGAELAERSRAASRRQHLVHRPAVWRLAVGRPPGRRGRQGQSAGEAQARASARRTRARSAARSRKTTTAVYRWDPSGRLDLVITADQIS